MDYVINLLPDTSIILSLIIGFIIAKIHSGIVDRYKFSKGIGIGMAEVAILMEVRDKSESDTILWDPSLSEEDIAQFLWKYQNPNIIYADNVSRYTPVILTIDKEKTGSILVSAGKW